MANRTFLCLCFLILTSCASPKMMVPAASMPAPPPPGGQWPDANRLVDGRLFNTEEYDRIIDNPFVRVAQDPLATFSVDVDTASYANMRRFLSQGRLPPRDSIRIEELLNYFIY